MNRAISQDSAPPIGEIRRLAKGDSVWLYEDATQRSDWTRYLDALMVAVTRGTEIRRAP